MHDPLSKTPDEEIGIRAFETKKARAVETATSRMRHGMGDSWDQLSTQQIEELRWTLGELWAYVAHGVWDELHFGLLSHDEINRIVVLGAQIRRHERPPVEVLNQIAELVSSKA
ncbi:MAG: hypothetical protein CVT67_07345 [Actinobacteria bacterium HGW-Actinobacteria-7]|jgi:hypothetical protein|nr:MAG: hypothetical protein CVT67_07345 [Actinobacteria bacterium HGW-Actinobacteria-7]